MNPIIKHRLYLKNNWLSFFPESIHDLVLGSVRWGVRGMYGRLTVWSACVWTAAPAVPGRTDEL